MESICIANSKNNLFAEGDWCAASSDVIVEGYMQAPVLNG
jgi:hypothetical protein